MAGLKNFIVDSFANISKRQRDGVMTQQGMEQFKEMMEDMDQAMQNNLNMEWKVLSVSVLGISFNLSDFVAFLSWTGLCLYALLGLFAAALISLPMDLGQKYFINRNWITLGMVLLLIAVLYFLLNFSLRKKNKENNLQIYLHPQNRSSHSDLSIGNDGRTKKFPKLLNVGLYICYHITSSLWNN